MKAPVLIRGEVAILTAAALLAAAVTLKVNEPELAGNPVVGKLIANVKGMVNIIGVPPEMEPESVKTSVVLPNVHVTPEKLPELLPVKPVVTVLVDPKKPGKVKVN